MATDGPRFFVDGKPFRFVGANVAVIYKDEERQRLAETLSEAAFDGVKVIRVWAHGEGGEGAEMKSLGSDRDDWPRKHHFRTAPEAWREEAFVHLNRVIAEAAKNKLYATLSGELVARHRRRHAISEMGGSAGGGG